MKKSIPVLCVLLFAVCGATGALLSCVSSTPTVNQYINAATPESEDVKVSTVATPESNEDETVKEFKRATLAMQIKQQICLSMMMKRLTDMPSYNILGMQKRTRL